MLGDKWAAFNVRPGGLVDQFQKEQINNLLLLYFPTLRPLIECMIILRIDKYLFS